MRIGRTKQTKNLPMKSLEPKNLSLETGTNADMQEINALKALKNPAHGGVLHRLACLVGKCLLLLFEGLTEAVFQGGI